MQFELPPLPYAADALEPHISKEQLFYHYEKHHRGYLNKLDAALTDPKRRARDLEEIIRTSEGNIFNSAAQLWNHTFLWHSLTPNRTQPDTTLDRLLEAGFGGIDGFRKAFADAAASEFGSGWSWLTIDPRSQRLNIATTHDAGTPLTTDQVPLLTLDVWEHAYYLDYKNDRAAYIKAFLNDLINWDFASANLERCLQPARRRASG
jgi:Fe-Mn family superoxide dismutase